MAQNKFNIDRQHYCRVIGGSKDTELLLNSWTIKTVPESENVSAHYILRNRDGNPVYISDVSLDPGNALRNKKVYESYNSKLFNEKTYDSSSDKSNYPLKSNNVRNRIFCKQYSTENRNYDDYTVLIFDDFGKLLFDEERFCFVMGIKNVLKIEKMFGIQKSYKITYQKDDKENLYGLLNDDFIPVAMSLNTIIYRTHHNGMVLELHTHSKYDQKLNQTIVCGQDELDYNYKQKFNGILHKERKEYMEILEQKRLEVRMYR